MAVGLPFSTVSAVPEVQTLTRWEQGNSVTKILVAVPFGLGIFTALALLPGYQGYAAALGSYGGMMLALVGWTPMPMIAKVRAGEAGSILVSIKALPSKLPFLNRGEAEAAETDPDPVGLDDVDSMLADLAAAAEEEAPAPSAGLGDVVDAPANSEPEPVAVAAVSVVEPTPSRFPLFAKLLAIPMAFLAKIRPHREPAAEPVAADAEPATPGLRAMAFMRSLLAKLVSRESADDVDELNPVEPTPSKTLRERDAEVGGQQGADRSVAGVKRSTIATATCRSYGRERWRSKT